MTAMKERLRGWVIEMLLDLLCETVPQGDRYELIIKPSDDNTMIAVLREREGCKR